ncbi:D-alanine--D-alanine ligase [Chitinispirillum alkaliphilum]|nr:D-alanine--D-alanine ligase [Chitinispirillum alkaliphilum]
MKMQVNVLMGGPSAEHEVSLRSGEEILTHLNKDKYRIRAVVISREKQFFFCDIDQTTPDFQELSSPESSPLFKGPLSPFSCEEIWGDCDAALLALHGTFGEDGVIQGYLETLNIPYSGSGVYSSAVAMNKITSKVLYETGGLTVAPYSIFGRNNPDITVEDLIQTHGFPMFAKCPQSGSSRLLGSANDKKSLMVLLENLLEESDDILVETTIKGTEFSCGVLQDSQKGLYALPPVEIRPLNSKFFDYDAKYSDGASLELVPAPHPFELLEQVKEVALIAHKLLGCSGYSRTDMIYSESRLYVLETNTLPGMTSNSLLPKEFKAEGGSFSKLLDKIISTITVESEKECVS